MKTRRLCLLAILTGLLGDSQAADDMEWRHRARQGGVTLTANPLGAATRTSFYTARGFTVAAIAPYVRACGFSFGMHNGGAVPLSARLVDWRAIDADGTRIPLLPPSSWDAVWENAGVASAARIAFRWAQFQAENIFEPGDWIMGMATLAATPASPFRLVASYVDDQGNHEIHLDQLVCAKD